MSKETDLLSQRAKTLLAVEGEHSLFELCEMLREFRNRNHPDQFQDRDAKEKAEERFKNVQSLIEEIERHNESLQLDLSSTQLSIYKPLYDLSKMSTQLDKAQLELKDARKELESEKTKNIELNKKVLEKNNFLFRGEIEHLQSLYEPSNKNIAAFGVTTIFIIILTALSQTEGIAGYLEKYSPVSSRFIFSTLVLFTIFFLFNILREFWERSYIRHRSEEVCSSQYAKDFLLYLEGKKKPDRITEFSESEVCDFLTESQAWKQALAWLGFRVYNRSTVNLLKDLFIHNLLNKRLIEIARASGMQRYFAIKVQTSWESEAQTGKE